MSATGGMQRVSTKGPMGIATVRQGKSSNGKPAVKVTFLDEDGNPGDSYVIAKTDESVPEYIQDGKFHVALSGDRKRIISMRPVSGQFKGKVKTFVAREGEKPTPQTKTGQYGPYEVFRVILEITNPEKYAGMEVFLELPYKFVAIPGEIKGSPAEITGIPSSKSASVAMLDDFIMASKACVVGPIQFSDNILPVLQKRILHQAATIDFVMKNGWVSAINPPDINEDGEDEDWAKEAESKHAGTSAKGKPSKPAPVDDEVTDYGEPDEVTTADKEDKEESPDWDDVEE